MNWFRNCLLFLLPCIIIVPFIVIAFFNHPALDDWWYAEVYSQFGFAGAQHYWYTHYTARFFSNALMTLEPLSFGWIEGHKLMPVVFIAVAIATFFYISKVFFSNCRRSALVLSLWFTATYLLIQRDYFEAIYWLSANVVYQYTMLYFLLHVTMIYEIYFLNKLSAFKKIVAILLAIAIVGSNETLGGLILAEAVIIFFYRQSKKKLRAFSVALISVVVMGWIVMFLARGNWDKIKVATGEHLHTFDFLLSVKHSFFSVAYYSFFLVKQLFFWCLAILGVPVLKHFSASFSKRLEAYYFLLLSSGCFLIAFTIYFISIYPTGILIPPLRVTNIAMFFLFIGTVSFIAFIATQSLLVASLIVYLNNYKPQLMAACILFAILGPSQFRQLLGDLFSGKAAAYNKAMYNRYELVKKHHGTTTLQVPKIINVPRSIVATDISGPVGENMAMVFGKKFKVKIMQ